MRSLPTLNLSGQEKRFIVLGGSIFLIILAVFGWVLPTFEKISRLDRAIVRERRRLAEVRQLHRAAQTLSKRETQARSQLQRRSGENFSIASVIEGMAREANILDQVQYLKPDQAAVSETFREVSVAVKVTSIDPKQLLDFLYRIESSDRLLRIKSLQIRTQPKQPGRLDTTMTVFTLLSVKAAA